MLLLYAQVRRDIAVHLVARVRFFESHFLKIVSNIPNSYLMEIFSYHRFQGTFE